MKRLVLMVSGLILTAGLFAQTEQNTQVGKATHEMTVNGFYAAHDKLPIDAKVKIVNIRTRKGIEVPIYERIPESPDRIIDLSSDTWKALVLYEHDIVAVTYIPPTFPHASTSAYDWDKVEIPGEGSQWASVPGIVEISEDEIHLAEELAEELKTEQQELHTEIVIIEEAPPVIITEEPVIAHIPAVISIPDEPVQPIQTVHAQPGQTRYRLVILDQRKGANAAAADSKIASLLYSNRDYAHEYLIDLFTSPAPELNVKVIPGLPDPNDGRIYHLQVGAFNVRESAARTLQRVKNTGLNAVLETYGSVYRVLAVNIRSADLNTAVFILGHAGFTELWIR